MTGLSPPRLVAYQPGDYGMIYCPGCQVPHAIYLGPDPPEGGSIVPYNGRPTAPTFVGKIDTVAREQIYVVPRCAFTITAGRIAFDKSSGHALAGKTVDLPAWPKGYWPGDVVPALPINRQKMP